MPLVVLVVVMSAGFIGGGIFMLVVQRTGERTTATVSDCVHRRSGKATTDYCTGTWVEGGSVFAGGRVVRGTIDGAGPGDIGEKVDVRLSGGRAYTTSLRLPIILLVIGLLFAVFGGREIRKQLSGSPPAGNAR
jgi:hypothetical protein